MKAIQFAQRAYCTVQFAGVRVQLLERQPATGRLHLLVTPCPLPSALCALLPGLLRDLVGERLVLEASQDAAGLHLHLMPAQSPSARTQPRSTIANRKSKIENETNLCTSSNAKNGG